MYNELIKSAVIDHHIYIYIYIYTISQNEARFREVDFLAPTYSNLWVRYHFLHTEMFHAIEDSWISHQTVLVRKDGRTLRPSLKWFAIKFSSVLSYVTLVLSFVRVSFLWYLGKAVLRNCSISWVSLRIILTDVRYILKCIPD